MKKRKIDYNKVGFIYKRKGDKSTHIIILHTKREFNSFYKLVDSKEVKLTFVFDKNQIKNLLNRFK